MTSTIPPAQNAGQYAGDTLCRGKEGYLVDPEGKVARTGREQDSGAIVFSSLDDAVVAAVGRLT